MSEVLRADETERMLLGAILVRPTLLPEAEGLLKAEHFGDQRNGTVWAHILTLSEQAQAIDLVMLKEQLVASGSLDRAGGVTYVASLVDGMPNVAHVDHWARVIHDKARRRAVVALAERAIRQAGDGSVSTESLLDGHLGALERVAQADERRTVEPARDVVKRSMARLDKWLESGGRPTGVPTGLDCYDELTGGNQAGWLVVVAARPRDGKSTMLAQWALTAAINGYSGLMFSLEMLPEEMAERMIFARAGVDKWTEMRFDYQRVSAKVAAAYGELSDSKLHFDKRESPTVAQIRATCKTQRARAGLDFVMVDHLQRIQLEKVKGEENWLALGNAAQALKSLARNLGIPVIVACQLNRGAETEEPTLANLAQSGRIEQEADLIVFLHPKAETRDSDEPTTNLIVAKNRHGATLKKELRFQKKLNRFASEPTAVFL